jgi:MerR family transcriptional regulator, light-induced transcriptional regulator
MPKLNSLQRLNVPASANDECKESLHDVIVEQLIPRLLNSQNYSERLSTPEVSGDNLGALPEFSDFTDACRQGDSVRVNQIVDALIAQGLTQERIFLDLITPAARHLGTLWDNDLCSFTDVTCGLAIMHHVIYRLGYEFRDGPHVKGEQTNVMMCCAPGSLHLLGATIVGDLFRREGASVVIEISSTQHELVRAVANEWFDVIGISVAIESQLLQLKTLVQELKKSSGNPNVKVLLGGPIFMLVDATADMFDADTIAKDAQEVVHLLKSFAAKQAT